MQNDVAAFEALAPPTATHLPRLSDPKVAAILHRIWDASANPTPPYDQSSIAQLGSIASSELTILYSYFRLTSPTSEPNEIETVARTYQDELSFAFAASARALAEFNRGNEDAVRAIVDPQERKVMVRIELHALSTSFVGAAAAFLSSIGVRPDNAGRVARALAGNGQSLSLAMTMEDRKSLVVTLQSLPPIPDPAAQTELQRFVAALRTAPCGELCHVLP